MQRRQAMRLSGCRTVDWSRPCRSICSLPDSAGGTKRDAWRCQFDCIRIVRLAVDMTGGFPHARLGPDVSCYCSCCCSFWLRSHCVRLSGNSAIHLLCLPRSLRSQPCFRLYTLVVRIAILAVDCDAKAPRTRGAFLLFHTLDARCTPAGPSNERLRDAAVDLQSMSFSEVRLHA